MFKPFVNREKEEAYLNVMNKQGWKLLSVQFSFYTFQKTEPGKYKTVFHFTKRQQQAAFVRTVTECGCDIAHQSNEGKQILFYINVPVEYATVDFLTDNQSKLDFKRSLNNTRKRELSILFVCFVVFSLLLLYPFPSIIKILCNAPEVLFEILKDDPMGSITFVGMIICDICCGVMWAYIFRLYSRTKREIEELSNKMKVFE